MTPLRLLVCALLSHLSLALALHDYQEQLILQPLAPASLLASFNFRTNVSLNAFRAQHFGLFPRSLGQILEHAKARELHLRFSTGRWDSDFWGTRPWDGTKEGGTGVEIWAWVEADTDEEAFSRWITLNNALSGLFCASMNFIDSTRTSKPVMTFEPAGSHGNASFSNLHLLHGALTREVVCTENLTPFLKLLPCKGKAGIASLLDGHKLFDATWQSMSIDVRPVCFGDGQDCVVEMDQTVDMVLDIERSKRPRHDPIPRPLNSDKLICDETKKYPVDGACYPLDLSSNQEWSFISMFGRSIKGTCLYEEPPAKPPTVCLRVPNDLEIFSSWGTDEKKDEARQSRCLNVQKDMDFEILVTKQKIPQTLPPDTPPLFAERSITGHGQERGGVRALLTNPSNSTVEFIYFEALPWFMKPYVHTLNAKVGSLDRRRPVPTRPVIKDMYYRPGMDRQRGSQLELHMEIPPQAQVTLTYDFEKSILRYTEYPPDANRGRDVAPAVIRLVSAPDARGERHTSYIRTTPLMLPLPTPDFSMPYNVIILTSTVIALAFGTLYNMLVRRFVGADEAVDKGILINVIRAVGQKIKARVAERIEARQRTEESEAAEDTERTRERQRKEQ